MSDAAGKEIAERTRKLTPADKRQLCRELATGDRTRSQLARHYGVSPARITGFAKEHAREIDAIRADLDNQFAGLWIASKEHRIAAYQADFETSAEGDYSAHYEQVRTRTAILRNVAEELGQLPTRSTTAIIVPVVHQVIGVDLDALKLKTGRKNAENGPVSMRIRAVSGFRRASPCRSPGTATRPSRR